jgi:hypothetical protein
MIDTITLVIVIVALFVVFIIGEKIGAYKKHKDKFIEVQNGYNRPLEYCDGILGFKVEDWLEYITPKIKDAWRWCYDHKSCRKPMRMKGPPKKIDKEVERLFRLKQGPVD